MSTLAGKVAIVTGGSRGIGRAVAHRLARDGAAVTVGYASRAADAGETVAAIREIGGKVRSPLGYHRCFVVSHEGQIDPPLPRETSKEK